MTTLIFLSLMLSGTFFLGVSDILKKRLLNEGVNDQVLLIFTSIWAGILLLPILIIFGFPQITPKFWGAFSGTVVLNLLSQFLLIKAFKYSDASVVSPLRLIIPIFVLVTGYIFLKESPTIFGIIGVLVTVVGLSILLVDFKALNFSIVKEKGVLYGLSASFLFGLSFPLDKIAVINSSAIFTTALVFPTIGIIWYIIHAYRSVNFRDEYKFEYRSNWRKFISVTFFQSVGVALTNAGFNYALAVYVSSLKRLQSLWAVVLAGRFLGEKDIKRKTIASIVMFCGVILTILFQ